MNEHRLRLEKPPELEQGPGPCRVACWGSWASLPFIPALHPHTLLDSDSPITKAPSSRADTQWASQ